ncbi:LOW QUALITY PROTEIN: probable cytochrome P450 6u1 [Drosophila nasuta]|uniref:LOW QUALITY PROTEIN: probable cytochrome P450 6u1 n=1 Tax=Drosophila nasuta TaxID=42062 RepID=UPI00295EA271|nr:LOW QUALITY PROTEIN: probable cytochrome P450 6u1 [Drosophila nasuta]
MDLLHRVLFTAFGTLTLFYVVVKISLGYWKRRGILHEKPKFLWGNIKGVVGGKRHVLDALQTIYDTHKGQAPFVGCYALLKPFVMVLDLELVHNILVSDEGYFTSRGLYNNMNNEPLSGNLLQLDGHKWRSLHAKSVTVFTSSNLQKLMPRLLQVSNIFGSRIGEQKLQQFNVSQLVDGYNIEVIGSLAFGLTGDQVEFRQMSRSYWNNFSLWRAYLALELPLLARLVQYTSYDELATNYFYNLVHAQLYQQRLRDRQPLQTFLQLFSAADDALSDAQIAAQAFGFILAGLEPLNATLGFCLYELALQPDLQDRVRSEIQQLLHQHDGQLTADSLKQLKYTKQVLNETLRLHTPYPFLLRRATKEFELAKSVFVIARGNNLIIPVAAIHRDPSIYPDPLRFDPDRFEAAAVKARPAMSFLPFGQGLRGCIAMQLAEQQLLIGLVALLHHHKYAPCAETQIPLQYDNRKLLLMPKTDIQLSVEYVDT